MRFGQTPFELGVFEDCGDNGCPFFLYSETVSNRRAELQDPTYCFALGYGLGRLVLSWYTQTEHAIVPCPNLLSLAQFS